MILLFVSMFAIEVEGNIKYQVRIVHYLTHDMDCDGMINYE
jgi:hypothetical protein